jgi:hypothetical protein
MNNSVYIAGKITGLDNYKENFELGERDLIERGFKPMTSVRLNAGFEHEEYMHICYAMVDVCDNIYMLRDWKDSKGAILEHKYAIKNQKNIIYEDGIKVYYDESDDTKSA